MKPTKTIVLVCLAIAVGTVTAFSMSMMFSNKDSNHPASTMGIERRSFVKETVTTAGIATIGLVVSSSQSALAEETKDDNMEISSTDTTTDFITTESGMQYKVLKEGNGAIPSLGQTVKAHYTGWLNGFDSDTKFDSSRDRGRPFSFAVGKGQVIRGWDETFSNMKVGERRQIILPPRLAYGDRGAGGIIPGGATLYFDVELLGIL